MQIVKLNLIPGGVLPVCFASQHDTGRVIRFMLFEGENVFTLSGAETIALRLQKPDGSELVESVTNTGADYVDVVTTADTCDTAGASVGEIVITDGGDVLGSANFGLFVESDAFDGGGITTQTATGAIATFETNIETAFVSLKSDINPVQDLHGYSKPWSGGGGKNKLNCTATTETKNGVTLTVVKNSANQVVQINVTGTATAGVSFTLGTATIEAGTYVLNGYSGGSSVGTKYINYSGIANAYGSNVTSTISETKTTTASLQIANGAETGFTIYPMIRLSSTSEDYEPYSNICPISGFSALNVTLADENMQTVDTATVNFGQTVYGGVLDVTSGKVTVTHVLKNIGANDISDNGTSGGLIELYVNGTNNKKNGQTNMICNNLEVRANASAYAIRGRAGSSSVTFCLPTSDVPDFNSAKTWVTNNPIELVYELATPIEIDTTAENLTAISGENNVYGDTNGDTTVEYYIEV